MLHIQDLSYQYSDICYHYSLQLEEGNIVAILGKSGSGKSTFFDLISGFLEPQSGVVLLDDAIVSTLAIDKRPITILFQQHNTFEHLSIEKNILLGDKDVTPSQIEEILKEVGLEGFGERKASKLSGGQQQRVGLARALIRKKPILLLDEPFTGLDKETRTEMLALVRKITDENSLHTIMVTHEEDDCVVADKVYRMENHRLVLS